MFSLNFMFLCTLIEELCTKEENDKTSCNFNFGHECIYCLFYMEQTFYPKRYCNFKNTDCNNYPIGYYLNTSSEFLFSCIQIPRVSSVDCHLLIPSSHPFRRSLITFSLKKLPTGKCN